MRLSWLSRSVLLAVGFGVVGLALGVTGASAGDRGKQIAGFTVAVGCAAALLRFAWTVHKGRRPEMEARGAARKAQRERQHELAWQIAGACFWAWIAFRNIQYSNDLVGGAFLFLSLIWLVFAAETWRSQGS